jgi:hypothetical protein
MFGRCVTTITISTGNFTITALFCNGAQKLHHSIEEAVTKLILYKYSEGTGRTYLAQDRNQWWAPVNTIMNLQVPWKVGNFSTNCVTISCSKTLLQGIAFILQFSKNLKAISFLFLIS